MNTSEENILLASKKVRGDKRLYVSFMGRRFPAHSYHTVYSYALEWAERFNEGEPNGFMDSESLEAYNKVQEGFGVSQ